ncbi:hypothetical protein B0I35DRAFT_406227 [Stachybotrys elegans]|uniref:Thioester reductase (TE) domain-containing protein n=1 Tax=Stachybotrys elegans TaxID=80388 RepID=A0A8K0T2H5_9HYPO|nr:hypothetical protein B0I35DRAFT_406227 [Stachybotrys elegans]
MLNLFSLAASVYPAAQIVFISSVGAVAGNSGGELGPTSESNIRTLDAAHANGYSQSKLLAELLCETASQLLEIPVVIARVGGVERPACAGDVWNRSEWLPSFVKSSFHLGCLPDSLGLRFSSVDWMPSDPIAEVIVDTAMADMPSTQASSNAAQEYNIAIFKLRNPSTTT